MWNRLFVTGGTGFLGGAFLEKASAEGREIVAICRTSHESTKSIRWLTRSLSDVSTDDFAGCDACVHFAAAGVTGSANDWDLCFDVNVRQSLALWRTAVAAGVKRLVICGSCFEYGRSGDRYAAIPVSAPLEPVTAYGASKAAATVAAQALAVTENLSVSVLRPFHLYGMGEASTRFWPALRAAALAGADFPMTAGTQVRDFTPVSNAAAQFVAELGRPVALGCAIIRNVGTGQGQSLRAFASRCWTEWGGRGQLLLGAVPDRPNEVRRYVPVIDQHPS